jgi:type I restriction enzyme M protein
MLDDVTKKRINTLRQILVGKLPDPKAQVEQITNGLIYKFMNDMDEESISMGGKSTYFSGKYQKYSWKNLLDTKTSGIEKLSLYSEAIEQMYNNENLPELFREIFKNSFLPFKDPSTLNMFLKEINEFHYSHSEKLGDAFEYLLSFMGSQGDAGQFRTPRHIIDFIVEIVNPQKNETVLDPACGTAGFLISSYKHILKQNTKKNLGDGLTVSDRKKIGENLNGYDISPDMVKMSLVNMYLHKFTNPKINEYDTLSSEDKWNEYYDIILANPPFFSPKGGIMPHNRFGVKSTKAEVLFVDYINEHLKPKGRAGIIVPEGVIFQTGAAYKQLRKKLIETSLVGVVSLPAGVFQPYSGVKTSILILDKKLNKELDKILFLKIENDGFSLNTQRKKINLDDILKSIKSFNSFFNNEVKNIQFGSCLYKEKLLKTNNYLLIEDIKENSEQSDYDKKSLLELADFYRGITYKKSDEVETIGTKVLRANNVNIDGSLNMNDIKIISKKVSFKDSQKLFKNDILMCTASGSKEHIGKTSFIKEDLDITFGGFMGVLRAKEKMNPRLLYFFLKDEKFNEHLRRNIYGANINNINNRILESFRIPTPPIETQNQIIDELDGYQKIIDGCRQVIENYKPSIDIDHDWEMVELGEVISLLTDYHANGSYEILKKNVKLLDTNNYALMVRTTNFENNDFNKNCKYIDENSYNFLKKSKVFQEDIIINKIGSAGSIYIMPDLSRPVSLAMNQFLIRSDRSKINAKYLYHYLKQKEKNIKEMAHGAVTKTITKNEIRSIKIHRPSKEIQNKILEELNDEEKTIVNNKKLIVSMQKKIYEKINKLWSS